MTKYRSTCSECQRLLSQLALSSGICTPCWWRVGGWETGKVTRWTRITGNRVVD